MDAVMGRRVEDPFERAQGLYELSVDPELIDEVETVHDGEHPRSKAEQHDGGIEHPVQQSRKPALTHSDAEIIELAGMVNDVEVPEQPGFMADTVEPIVSEVVDEKENGPRPPCISWKLIRGEGVRERIERTDEDTEKSTESHADETYQNVVPRIAGEVRRGVTPSRVPGLYRDQRREDGYRNDDGIELQHNENILIRLARVGSLDRGVPARPSEDGTHKSFARNDLPWPDETSLAAGRSAAIQVH